MPATANRTRRPRTAPEPRAAKVQRLIEAGIWPGTFENPHTGSEYPAYSVPSGSQPNLRYVVYPTAGWCECDLNRKGFKVCAHIEAARQVHDQREQEQQRQRRERESTAYDAAFNAWLHRFQIYSALMERVDERRQAAASSGDLPRADRLWQVWRRLLRLQDTVREPGPPPDDDDLPF